MKSVYEECPVLSGERFEIRLLKQEDAEDLFKVYSDKKSVPYFNDDNCHGSDFYFKTLDITKESIKYWLMEYDRHGFVRFSIKDKDKDEVIGTIELFNRKADDYFTNCGVMRLDLRSDYENEKAIYDILNIIVEPSYKLFECESIITKAKDFATERISALEKYGFTKSDEKLIGWDGTKYGDYFEIKCHN